MLIRLFEEIIFLSIQTLRCVRIIKTLLDIRLYKTKLFNTFHCNAMVVCQYIEMSSIDRAEIQPFRYESIFRRCVAVVGNSMTRYNDILYIKILYHYQ